MAKVNYITVRVSPGKNRWPSLLEKAKSVTNIFWSFRPHKKAIHLGEYQFFRGQIIDYLQIGDPPNLSFPLYKFVFCRKAYFFMSDLQVIYGRKKISPVSFLKSTKIHYVTSVQKCSTHRLVQIGNQWASQAVKNDAVIFQLFCEKGGKFSYT